MAPPGLRGSHSRMLKRWPAFTPLSDDGRICLTNNAAERALRGIAIGRKAWLFAGSDHGGERAASMFTLIETAKLNGIDPRPGSPTCCVGSPIIRSPASTRASPGIGKTAPIKLLLPDRYRAAVPGGWRPLNCTRFRPNTGECGRISSAPR